jgi:hypothetical protein
MDALHPVPGRKPSLHDGIVAFLRERPGGVSPGEVAERFLKLRAPDPKTAAAAIAGMLGADRRCFTDADGRWHASAGSAQPAEALGALPWIAVYCLTDPGARRLLYLALWEITPSLSCLGSGWLVDPRSLPYDECEVLQSAADGPFSRGAAAALLAAVARAGERRLPVFMSSHVRGLVAAACLTYGESLTDDTVLAGQLLKAAGAAVPRPLTLEAFEQAVLGAEQGGASARKRGERFAASLAELLQTLAGKGIESREQLDRCLRDDTAPLFAGKEFTYDTLLALPARPGVYGFRDAAGAYLYIGKTNNLRRRLLSYFSDTDESPVKIERLRAQSRSFVAHPCGSELECLIYEYRLIRKYMPPLNRQTQIFERKGTFRPIDDCIVLLPHAAPGKGMSVWFRHNQKILLKPFSGAFDTDDAFVAELKTFFFSRSLPPAVSDFPEQEIAVRWIKRHADTAAIVPVSRHACADEIYDAMRIAWRDLQPSS